MDLHSVFKGVVAYVEVRSGNDNRSAAIAQELRYLGAQVEPTFTDAVTHVVFKEGLKRTWNKAMRRKVHLVSVSWIDSCKQNQKQMPEKEFAAGRPEEISSPLPRINQPVRWKKMKSMQPCDFDEELARSAERGEKKRRRMMAGKFVLNEEMTPTSSSPIPVLAFETQARRSPIPTTFTRVNSPIPDTPPSMQERLERMRREQRQVLDLNLDHSPPGTPKAQTDSVLQRRLYDLFTMDVMSSNEEDENASKTVAKIIHSLGSNSECGSQPSADRKGVTALASETSKKESCGLKNLVPETQSAVPVSSSPSINDTCQTSRSSKVASILSDRRATRTSRMSCVYNPSTSSASLDQNNSASGQNISVNNSENKSRRSLPLGGRLSTGRRTSSMLNALSPKDLNIDTPQFDTKLLAVQESLDEFQGRASTVKISEDADGSFRSDRRLLEAVSEVNDDNSEKVMTAKNIDNVEIDKDSFRAQLGQQRTKRLSKRQSLISVQSKQQSLISTELKQQSLISKEKANVDLSSGCESEKGCVPTRACLVEFDKQNNKEIANSTSGVVRGSTDRAAAESSTALKVAQKKRNLFAGAFSTAFPMCSVEASSRQKSPEAISSHKSKVKSVGSDIRSDISFMFGFAKSHDIDPKEHKTKRRSTRLNRKSPQASVVGHSESGRNITNCLSKNMPADNERVCRTAIEGSSVSSYEQQNQSSFGDSVLKGEMSMSMAYGHDSSSTNITRGGTSRRSLDEFRANITSTRRDKKPSRLSVLNSKHTKCCNNSQKIHEVKNKLMKPNGNAQNKRMKRSISPSSNSSSRASAKRHKGCDLLAGMDVDSTLSENSLAEDDQMPVRLRHAHSLLMEQKRQAPVKKSSYSLVVTSLHRHEQETVYAIVNQLGLFHMTDNVDMTSTHVVCGESRRTLNLLKAIASGCWLLTKEWVLESLEAGTWLQEESYEMRDIPAAVKSRSERQKVGPTYKVNLFSKCGPIFVSSVCTPPRKEIVHLINLCSGQVTGSETRAAIHLGDDHNPKKLVIKPLWVLDCIMKLEILPTDNYIVFPKTSNSHRESSPEF